MGLRVLSFVRRVAGLSEPSLESEFYEEFRRLARFLELVVVTDDVSEIPEEFRVLRVRTVRFPKLYGLSKILAYLHAVWRLRRWIDVLYVRTFSPPESLALWFGVRVLGLRGLLLLPGTWLFEPPTLKNRLWRWILSRAVGVVDLLVLYTPLMLPDVRRYFPKLEEGRVAYVHNAVDVRRFRPRKPRREVAERLGIQGLGRIVLYVGRVSRRKGVDELVKAFARVAESEWDPVLLIAGREDPGYGRLVREIAVRERVAERVRFLGPVPNSEVPDLMCSASVFAYASRGGEGIPRAILEAMACGVPVVATRVAGVPEAVRDGVTGFLAEVGDVEGLAKGILRLLRDEELRKRMGGEARRLVEREFSYDAVIPRLVGLLERAAGRREDA